jgi:hypothetical protein
MDIGLKEDIKGFGELSYVIKIKSTFAQDFYGEQPPSAVLLVYSHV